MIQIFPTEITPQLASSLLRPRPIDGHKGTFGHMLLVAGKHGMMGAAVLAARAALRSGLGKLTVHLPERAGAILQIAVPEALLQFDEHSNEEWQSPINLDNYQSFVIGPGIGQSGETQWVLRTQLRLLTEQQTKALPMPLVLDADALNLAAQDYQMLSLIPQRSILTPHLGEMKRLATALELPAESPEQLLYSAQQIACELQLNLVVKSNQSHLFLTDGRVFINRLQGNSGMATAGSGDVLAGIIGSLLAQGYTPEDAAVLGVYLHAQAGDAAAKQWGEHSLMASDLVEHLPQAFFSI